MTSQFVQQIGDEGIHLPRELIQQWGGREGQEVIVECSDEAIKIVPAEMDPRRIADLAATYLLDSVGDAVSAGQPKRVGDCWEVPIMLSYGDKRLGVLAYSPRGKLIEDKSDSPQVVRERSRED
jgi:hypothetical protein